MTITGSGTGTIGLGTSINVTASNAGGGTTVGAFTDYFSHICEFERTRAAQYGIQHFCTIAMNPREANNVKLARQVYAVVEEYLDRESCVALGEIGFDRQTKEEEEAIRIQLRMSKKRNLPVMVHLPHQFKKIGTERTLQVVGIIKRRFILCLDYEKLS